jgi:hypothetical protein
MTLPRIPTHQPLTFTGQCLTTKRGKRMLCLASAEQVDVMLRAIREHTGGYRAAWHHPTRRGITCHETREHTTVTTWDVDHRPVDRETRVRELEAAPMYEPMEEAA